MKRKRVRVKRLRQWVRIVLLRHSNYAVVFTDEFGQVIAFDTHGQLLESRLATRRDARLGDIIHRRAITAEGA
jgi:hypothetical protein